MSEIAAKNILVIEDNPVNQRVVERLLQKDGHTVSLANNGQEGVEAVQNGQFDIVFMDIQMPVMDGVTAAKTIRGLGGQYAKLPIIALTANVMKGDPEKYFAAGMNECLAKPIERPKLREAIEKYATGTSAMPASATTPAVADASDTAVACADLGAHLDLEAINQLGDTLGKETMESLVDMFVSDVENRIAGIQKAVEENNIHELEKEAHTLKGMAANLAAMPLSQKASDVVTYCREGDEAAAISNTDGLPELAQDAKNSLKAWVAS